LYVQDVLSTAWQSFHPDRVASTPASACWVCGGTRLRLARASRLPASLESGAFRISSGDYGRTGEVHQCAACGFLQCSAMTDVLRYYEDLEDLDYERTRVQRAVQEGKLLDLAARHRPRGRLLDIGAGSGILVEEARRRGYDAIGVEPGSWLHARARERGLPVVRGTFPHAAVRGVFDVITLIDVIEHVPDPVGLLTDVAAHLAPGGVALVATPDVGSLAARVLGWRWWHFRIAHIGYFDRATLGLALRRAGLTPRAFHRPGWYMRVDYLVERLVGYLLPIRLGGLHGRLGRLGGATVPLNLRDSMAVVAARA
jgi:SAM-dependent methyltransferase